MKNHSDFAQRNPMIFKEKGNIFLKKVKIFIEKIIKKIIKKMIKKLPKSLSAGFSARTRFM